MGLLSILSALQGKCDAAHDWLIHIMTPAVCRCVQESAPALMGGISAGELKGLSPPAFDALIFRAGFAQHCLKLRIAEETYNDETRIKVTVTK